MCSAKILLIISCCLSLCIVIFTLLVHYHEIGVDKTISFKIGVWKACAESECKVAQEWPQNSITSSDQEDDFKEFMIPGIIAAGIISLGAVGACVFFIFMVLQITGCMDHSSTGGLVWNILVLTGTIIVLTVGVILMANTYDLFAKKEVSTNPSERQKAILAIAQNMGSKQPITQPQFGFAFVMPIIAILTAVACLILVILAACLCPSEAKKKEKSGKKDASGESGSKGGHKKNQSKPKK
ncbi:uncharacterized protein LOC142339790 [Convolutriloba macropyga]|uniref:uncharacterized protein LOC142339790 n=1 Tax=Convolutriloba macropyga TaxID=536237 RepID=UPI003F52568E